MITNLDVTKKKSQVNGLYPFPVILLSFIQLKRNKDKLVVDLVGFQPQHLHSSIP